MDTVLGLVELAAYVIFVMALAMAVTFVVVRVSPSQSAKERDQRQ